MSVTIGTAPENFETFLRYNGTVTYKYADQEHVYYRVNGDEWVLQDGVTTVCHILDKSEALVPWGCKMYLEKMLATIPTIDHDLVTGDKVRTLQPMSFDAFVEFAKGCKSAHREKLDDAATVGKKAHAWLETYIKQQLGIWTDPLPPLPDDLRARSCIEAGLGFMKAHNVRWRWTERKVFSLKFQYAGTADGCALVDSCNNPACCRTSFTDKLSLLDWKSGNGVWNEYLLQTAAYVFAHHEETNEFLDAVWIVRLGKEDGAFYSAFYEGTEALNRYWRAFRLCLELSRQMALVKADLNEILDYKKTIEAQQKKAAKEAANRIRCRKADTYKGNRLSKCLPDGSQCEACQKIYLDKQTKTI